MSKDVKLFLLKVLVASLPGILIVGLYFVMDPFKVLRSYERYYTSGEPSYVVLNNDYISTEIIRTHLSERKYDSYIFGSSRSRFFEVADWHEHIQSTNSFHYDASGESLYGVNLKLKYLDSSGVSISNALIVLDRSLLSVTSNSSGHLFRKHPILSGECAFNFHKLFVFSFCNVKFLAAYVHLTTTGRFHDYMSRGGFLNQNVFDYNPFSNEIKFGQMEANLAVNQAKYYDDRRDLFYERSRTQVSSPLVIEDVQRVMLSQIADILVKHGSRYKIVISPLYDQKKLDSADLRCLRAIFGAENVYDFSGINGFTQSCTNYYETSHYRPHVAREMMSLMYQGEHKAKAIK